MSREPDEPRNADDPDQRHLLLLNAGLELVWDERPAGTCAALVILLNETGEAYICAHGLTEEQQARMLAFTVKVMGKHP